MLQYLHIFTKSVELIDHRIIKLSFNTQRHVRLVLHCPPYLSVTHTHTHTHTCMDNKVRTVVFMNKVRTDFRGPLECIRFHFQPRTLFMSDFSARSRTTVHTRQSEDRHVCALTNEDRKTEDPCTHAHTVHTHVNSRTLTCVPSQMSTERPRTLVHTRHSEDLYMCVPLQMRTRSHVTQIM